jgi:CDP-6-deoxy-D-xylo-4-hexulose-3-dehydrase
MNARFPLVKDTISQQEIQKLISWLQTNPRLTKGEHTEKFESLWSSWNGNLFSTFVNSGSSANLAAYYAAILSNRLKNNRVIVPAVSWSTTVAPAIQLGLEPIICDCNTKNLGLDVDHLKRLIEQHDPAMIVSVNVLGFANDYNEIVALCKENNIFLIEDSCESIGTVYQSQKTGCFGDISTFSFYYGHHMSTIEGGMVCTNDEELDEILKSIRCHGWDRDLKEGKKRSLRNKFEVDDFRAMYTFYYPGFNMRCTDLQAFLGNEQMKKIDSIVESREKNFKKYMEIISPSWGLDVSDHDVVSNFTFPLIVKNVDEAFEKLSSFGVESRPLICGSISRQPFWKVRYGSQKLKNADMIHDFGMYIPNNPDMNESDVEEIATFVKKSGILS